MPYHRRRRVRRGGPTAAVTQSTCVLTRKAKCRGCGQKLAKGDVATRLRLKKRFQVPCTGCGHKPAKVKYFHASCVPTDIDKAMGYDPAMHVPHAAPPAASVPPPPKPKSVQDLDLEAIAALEAAVLPRARAKGCTPQHRQTHPKHVDGCQACAIEKAFATFQNCKARVLRGSTPQEAEVATNVALKRIIDIVFA